MKKFFTFFIFLSFSFLKLEAEIAEKITIEGNNRISSDTIKIYGQIEKDDNYNESDLNKILNNLYETEFFEDVKVSITNNELKILVKEYPFVNQLIIVGEDSNKYKNKSKKLLAQNKKDHLLNLTWQKILN